MNSLPAIRAVVFDIGNVLIRWDPEAFFDREVGEARRRALFAAVDLHAMNARIDAGADFRATLTETARAYPAFAVEIHMWRDRWTDLAHPPIEHSVRLLRALKARGVPVFALSNFGAANFELSRAKHGFLDLFDRSYISGRLGLTKPGPGIYEALEADSGVAPEALLFTDDRDENIATARERGWQVHLFEGPRGFADRLVAEGVLSAKEAQ